VAQLRSPAGLGGLGHPLTLSLNLHTNENVDACQLRYRQFCDAVGAPWELDVPAFCDLGARVWADALFEIYLDAPPLDQVANRGGAWWMDTGGCGSTNPQLFMNKLVFDHVSSVDTRPSPAAICDRRDPHGFRRTY